MAKPPECLPTTWYDDVDDVAASGSLASERRSWSLREVSFAMPAFFCAVELASHAPHVFSKTRTQPSERPPRAVAREFRGTHNLRQKTKLANYQAHWLFVPRLTSRQM
jgi:hypothetical protein